MSAVLTSAGLAAEHIEALASLPGLFHAIEAFIQTNRPKAIALIQDVLPFLPPDSKYAVALKALLIILQPS